MISEPLLFLCEKYLTLKEPTDHGSASIRMITFVFHLVVCMIGIISSKSMNNHSHSPSVSPSLHKSESSSEFLPEYGSSGSAPLSSSFMILINSSINVSLQPFFQIFSEFFVCAVNITAFHTSCQKCSVCITYDFI